MKIAEALGQIQSSQPKVKLRDALMQVNPAYARAKKAEEARIVAEKTKAEALRYEENARFWETIAHPSGALKSVGTEIVGTTKAVGADLVNVLTPWNQNKIQDVQFGGKTFQTPSAKGADAGTLARKGEYKKAAGKFGEAILDVVSTVTPASITIKALKAGSILRAALGAGLATAPIGAGYGATGAMQEGAVAGDILKQSIKGAGIAFAGGATLGAIPGIAKALTKVIPKIEEVIGKLTSKETKLLETELTAGKTPEQAVDTILQSRPSEPQITKQETSTKVSKDSSETWYRGVDETNSKTGDKFFSNNESTASGFGKVEKIPENEVPKNPLIVDDKDALGVKMEWMKKDPTKVSSFDQSAKEYAQSLGHDGIVYRYGQDGNKELHTFSDTKFTEPLVAPKAEDPLLQEAKKLNKDYIATPTTVDIPKDLKSLDDIIYYDVRKNTKVEIDEVKSKLLSGGKIDVYRSGGSKDLYDGAYVSPFEKIASDYAVPGEGKTLKKFSVDVSDLKIDENSGHLVYSPKQKIDTSLPEQPKTDTTPKKESGYAKSLEEKAVEKKMADEFQDLAEYTPSVRKEQAKISTELINNDIERVGRILDGKEELPTNLRGSSLALAVEQHAMANGDVKLLQKLAKSKIATEISEAGSELSMLAGRNANSPVRIIRNIIKARKENVTKRLKGKKISEARKRTKESIKKAIQKEAPTKETWSNFIKEIKC